MTTPKPLVRRDFLAEAKKRWNANIKSAKSVNRDRLLSIDPDEDAYVLGHQAHTPTLTNVEDVAPLPLFGANGVVHTIGDLAEDGTLKPDTEYLRYQDWCVTPKALACVIWWAYVIDEKTKGLIEDFRVYLAGDIERPSSESKLSAVNLSERVCAWGGRPSIFDNMKKAQKRLDDLEDKLNNWFFEALKSNPGQALERCADIKGLGPSFGSKHLRFIDPDRYATLDNILSQAFGFAMTGKGYEDFLQSLKTFKEAYRLPYCIADIEHGLFFLTQPFFSSSPPQEHKLNSDKSPMFGSIDVGTLTRDFEKVTTYSPLIDIYRHKEGIEHWFGMESRQDNARRKLKLLLTVHPVQDGKAEVSHFSLTSRALNMRQTKEYLSYLYPAFSASKANLEWEHLKPFPWEKQKPAKRS